MVSFGVDGPDNNDAERIDSSEDVKGLLVEAFENSRQEENLISELAPPPIKR